MYKNNKQDIATQYTLINKPNYRIYLLIKFKALVKTS